jgi:hypothetical protein
MTFIERLLLLIPSRRRTYEARMLKIMAVLMRDPTLPCKVEGVIIPHGFGK